MIAPRTFQPMFAAMLAQVGGEIKIGHTMGKKMRLRMCRLSALAYRRVMRQADTRVDRWERECEFLGVPIHEDTEATDVTIRLETLKPKAREPLLRVVR